MRGDMLPALRATDDDLLAVVQRDGGADLLILQPENLNSLENAATIA